MNSSYRPRKIFLSMASRNIPTNTDSHFSIPLSITQQKIEMIFQGAGHNDVELYNQYLERLRHFVSQELTNWHTASAAASKSKQSSSHSENNENQQQQNNKKDATGAASSTASSKDTPPTTSQQDLKNNASMAGNSNNADKVTTTTTTANNTTSSSSLSISNQESNVSNGKTTPSEKFL